MKKISLLFLIALLGVSAFLAASCMTFGLRSPTGTFLIGMRAVDYKTDHDSVRIGKYDGSFRSIVFKAEKNDIEIFNIVVTYGNGEREMLDTRFVLNAQARSRVIGLNAGPRRIESIDFSYKTIGSWRDGRSNVQVYGLR